MGKIIVFFFLLIHLNYAAQPVKTNTILNDRIQSYIDQKFSNSTDLNQVSYILIVRNGTCYTLCNEKLNYFLDNILRFGKKKILILTNKNDNKLINTILRYDNIEMISPDAFELAQFGLDGIDHLLAYLDKGKVESYFLVTLSNYKKIIKFHHKIFGRTKLKNGNFVN